MRVLIVGAAGMLGRRLAQRIVARGMLAGQPVETLDLIDAVPAERPYSPAMTINSSVVDLATPATLAPFVRARPDVVFHLAAIVSGEAEANLDKGYAINLDGSIALFELIKSVGTTSAYCPRVIFASSIAVFGPPLPEIVDDSFALLPRTSYGTQKAMTELFLADYARRGIFDGISLRLPTICIRPGRPNKAASGFFSNILREPLIGLPAVLPVSDDVRHWFASPTAAIDFFEHAAAIDLAGLDHRRSLNLPGVSATVGEEIETLRRVAGPKAVALIKREPDAAIAAIVGGWVRRVDASRAEQLGFRADASFEAIVQSHIDQELNGQPVAPSV